MRISLLIYILYFFSAFFIAVLPAMVKAQNIKKIEYYIDIDPGFGKATAVTFIAGTDVTASFSFNVSSISAGFHTMYVRSFIDPYQIMENGTAVIKGGWSLTNYRQFYRQSLDVNNNIPANIVKGEYFADTDPGFGKGTNIPLTPGTDLTNISFAFDITSLSAGFHNLCTRFRNSTGSWSLTNVRTFYKEVFSSENIALPNIVQGEYFLDTDPGFGKGIQISLTAGTNLTNGSFAVDISTTAAGFHSLYSRFKDANGHWGLTYVRSFYKEDLTTINNQLTNIVAGEYYFNTDPGFDKGTAISIVAGTNATTSFIADITNLPSGFHQLYTRFKDANNIWGLTNHRFIYKEAFTSNSNILSKLIGVEYFIDNDPGFGNAQHLSVTPSTEINNIAFELDMSTLALGNHVLYVRALDSAGKWSLVNNAPFRVEPPSGLFITVGHINRVLCMGNTVQVPFTTTGPFSPGNVFTAQLSDINGSFVTPRNIGTLQDTVSGIIEAVVPYISTGNNYRIRVIGSSPNKVSLANDSALSINPVPSKFSILGDTVTCKGSQTYTLYNYELGIGKYIWSLSGGGIIDTSGATATINWTATGLYTITVKYTGFCAGDDSVKTLKVNVIDLPLTGTFTGMLPSNGNTNLSLPVTFSWLPIENATNYDLYIWTATGDRPLTPVASDLNAINYTVYSTSIIQYETLYKWQVVARRACYELPSQVQTFRLRYLPDLIVNKITLPASGFSGQSFSVNWEVKNIGQGGTLQGQWYDRVYLSKDAILDLTTDYYLGIVPNISELEPNASYSQTATFTLPQGISDNFYVFVTANTYNGLQETNLTNNTTISTTTSAIQLTPPPDLQVTSVVPPNFVFSGQDMQVTWKVTNAGKGATRTSGWSDYIYLADDTALNFSTAKYLGSAYHSGALEKGESYTTNKTVTLPNGVYGKHYLFVLTDVGNNVYEHAAENNNTGRSDSINIILTPPVDLIVTSLSSLSSASNKENITVQWRVENQGGSATDNQYWTDNVYLSPDSVFNSSTAIFLSGNTRPVALSPGEGYNVSKVVTIPNNITGKYFLYVVTDAYNGIYEYSYEDNNIIRSDSAITITTPDLVVSSLNIPASDTSGKEIQLSWSVRNNGSGMLLSANMYDRILLSSDFYFNPSNITELSLLNYTTGQLALGDSINKSATVRLPDGITGNFYIYVTTDCYNNVYEAGNDTNNTKRSPSFIKISLSPWPDLQVARVKLFGDTVKAAAVVSFSYTAINKGQKQISNSNWSDRLFISASPQWDSVNAIYLKEFSQSRTLPKDSSYTVNGNFIVPPQITGKYYLYVFADAQRTVFEYTSEENNVTRSDSFFVTQYPPIDLAVTSITAPGSASSGKPIDITWSVNNLSAAATIQSQWEDGLYLSRDTIWSASDDVLIKEFTHKGALGAGQSYSSQQSVIIPDGLSGTFYLIMVTDHSDFNKDINRKNNAKLVTQGEGSTVPVTIEIELTPPSDLVVTSLTIPYTGQAGQPITVKWGVKNNGVGTTSAKSWSDKVYLSTNTIIDGDDIALGTFIRTDSLKAGGEYNDSLQVFLPISTIGNYYVLLKTDANGNVYEYLAEDNNTSASVITVVKAPISDLIVSDILIPDSAMVGDNLTLQWKIKNAGANTANGYLKDGVYLSEDSIKDVNDILLVSKDNSINLTPQAEAMQTFTGELTGVALKNYHVLVHTDILNNIYESNDSNNITASFNRIAVTVPQLPISVLTQRTLLNGKEIYYRIEVPDSLIGETLLVTLKGDSLNGANEMFLRYGDVPTRAVYDYSYNLPYEGNQEIIVPELKAGTYYLMVTGSTTTDVSQPISLLAQLLNFELRYVDANKGGNTGPVTVLLNGSKLGNVTGIRLHNSSTIIDAGTIKIVDPTKVYVTFNLQDAALGLYDVVAYNSSGDSAILSNGFTVVNGVATNLITNVVTPPSTRPSTIISLTVQYTNSGNTDIINPVLRLTSLGGSPISFTVTDLANNAKDLTLTLQELNGPAGILRPGASGTIIVYAKALTALSFMLIK